MVHATILMLFRVWACFLLPACLSAHRSAGRSPPRVVLDSRVSVMQALAVALDAADDGGPWFASRLELQLVSLALCEACRRVRFSRVLVSSVTPHSLYVDGSSHLRVPVLRPYAVIWKMPPASLEASGNCLSGLKSLVIAGAELSQGVRGVVWPRGLERLVLGDGFNHPVNESALPESLFDLELGNDFNRAIDGVSWPPQLRRLKFGHRFDNPVSPDVSWPITLQHLSFGNSFFQPVDWVAWPSSLRILTFGWDISGVIDHVRWPGWLRKLHLGDGFNKEIEGIAWPATLEEMGFGRSFNQAIAEVAWPRSLRCLTFEGSFLTHVNDVAWPLSLRELSFGPHFYQSLQEVRAWPENLECMGLRLSELYLYMFSLDGLTWPPRLKTLTLSSGIRFEAAPMAGVEIRYVTLVSRGIGICRELVWERVEESPSAHDGAVHNRSGGVASVVLNRSQDY